MDLGGLLTGVLVIVVVLVGAGFLWLGRQGRGRIAVILLTALTAGTVWQIVRYNAATNDVEIIVEGLVMLFVLGLTGLAVIGWGVGHALRRRAGR